MKPESFELLETSLINVCKLLPIPNKHNIIVLLDLFALSGIRYLHEANILQPYRPYVIDTFHKKSVGKKAKNNNFCVIIPFAYLQ